MKNTIIYTLALFMLLSSGVLSAQRRSSIPLKHGAHRIGKRTDAEMKRWREHGLGQFIHWGVYAIPGGVWDGKTYRGAAEWIRSATDVISNEDYDNLYKQFNPTKFDAKAWAKQAKDMGARYMIFTTKHHDGFCLWPSKYTNYTVASTPYKKDIVKQVVDAYTAEGIDVHLYFSIIDWSQPGYISGGNINSPDIRKMYQEGTNHNPFPTEEDAKKYEEFKQFTRNQLLELLDNYPAIKGLWFDGSWDVAWVKNAGWVDSLGMELRTRHKDLIIGSRFRSDEYGYRHYDANGDLIDDYSQVFERNLPESYDEVKGNDWDCVMTIPENQWGYHRDWSLTYVKTAYDLISMTIQANTMDGNLVINFGPDGDGNIREEESRIAAEVGQWMKANGEAIYGVQHCPLEKQDWGYYTRKDDDIYMIVMNMPMNQKVRIKAPRSKEKGKIVIPVNAGFIETGQAAEVRDGGRDKNGYYYYDLPIPDAYKSKTMPFVIRINLKEIDLGDKGAYQQAIT